MWNRSGTRTTLNPAHLPGPQVNDSPVMFLSPKKPSHMTRHPNSQRILPIWSVGCILWFTGGSFMQFSGSRLLTATFAALLFSGISLAQSGSSGQAQAPSTKDPNINTPTAQQPAPPPTADKPKKDPGSDAPIASPDTVNPKSSKEDVDAIGNRSVGKGVNFYSLEKEIALGKQ